MSEVENKILLLLDSGFSVNDIVEELKIGKENLADVIIEFDTDGLVCLKNKNWILTQKGHDALDKIKESLKSLKLDYLDGNIGKDEFLEKRKTLEYVFLAEGSRKNDDIVAMEKGASYSKCGVDNNEGSKYCYKCGVNNSAGSKYCYKCGSPLSNV